MSLNDVDKDSVGRGSADLNADDVLRSRKGRGTSVNNVLPADTTKDLQVFGNGLRVILTDTIVLSRAASSTTGDATYAHNLGFTPVVIAYTEASGGRYALPVTFAVVSGAGSGRIGQVIYFDMDDTNIYFEVDVPDNAPTYAQAESINIRFYVLQNYADDTGV